MSTTGVIFNLVGLLGFLFLFWRRLKEDYEQKEIFTFSFLIVFGALVGVVICFFLLERPLYWFWAAFLGMVIGFLIGDLKFKFRFFETLEALATGALFWLANTLVAQSVDEHSLASLIAALVVTLLLALFFFLDGRYRGFAWYRSGRVGFAGLVTVGTFFLIRGIASLVFPSMLSFIGQVDTFVSASLAFAFFLMLFYLARKT